MTVAQDELFNKINKKKQKIQALRQANLEVQDEASAQLNDLEARLRRESAQELKKHKLLSALQSHFCKVLQKDLASTIFNLEQKK